MPFLENELSYVFSGKGKNRASILRQTALSTYLVLMDTLSVLVERNA